MAKRERKARAAGPKAAERDEGIVQARSAPIEVEVCGGPACTWQIVTPEEHEAMERAAAADPADIPDANGEFGWSPYLRSRANRFSWDRAKRKAVAMVNRGLRGMPERRVQTDAMRRAVVLAEAGDAEALDIVVRGWAEESDRARMMALAGDVRSVEVLEGWILLLTQVVLAFDEVLRSVVIEVVRTTRGAYGHAHDALMRECRELRPGVEGDTLRVQCGIEWRAARAAHAEPRLEPERGTSDKLTTARGSYRQPVLKILAALKEPANSWAQMESRAGGDTPRRLSNPMQVAGLIERLADGTWVLTPAGSLALARGHPV